jgi:hypothetical protein
MRLMREKDCTRF